MEIIGLISWYDERPDWLAAGVASLAPFVSNVVAIDGAYALYPEGKRYSPAGQAEAIRETARACHLGCTIVEPPLPWAGGEVEKRSRLFEVGETFSKSTDDWYFVLDGDELVTEHAGIKERLTASPNDVAQALLWHSRDHHGPSDRPFSLAMEEQHAIRVMFRVIPGLRVEGNHYTYVTPDGRNLWGRANLEPVEELQDIVRIEHRNSERDPWRAMQSSTYYERREAAGIESA